MRGSADAPERLELGEPDDLSGTFVDQIAKLKAKVAALEQERRDLLERLGIAWARSKTENEELTRLREAIRKWSERGQIALMNMHLHDYPNEFHTPTMGRNAVRDELATVFDEMQRTALARALTEGKNRAEMEREHLTAGRVNE